MEITIKEKKGIVIFIDILGYQSFLDSHNTQQVVERVLSTISTIPNVIRSKLKSLDCDLPPNSETLVFSDTVVVTVETKSDPLAAWMSALQYAGILCNHLFDFGMPVRAAIEVGSFYQHGYCFAGEAIASAYRLSSSLDVAACVLSKDASKELTELKASQTCQDHAYHEYFDDLTLTYLTPTKSGDQLLNHLVYPHRFFSLIEFTQVTTFDVSKIVSRSFWAHGKQLPTSARSKLTNTEYLFRYFQLKCKSCGFASDIVIKKES